jgi:hypothetical protein
VRLVTVVAAMATSRARILGCRFSMSLQCVPELRPPGSKPVPRAHNLARH